MASPPTYNHAAVARRLRSATALRRLLAAGQGYRVVLARVHDLHIVDVAVIELLGQAARPLTQQQVSLRLSISPGTLTAVVDRLEAANLLERRRHPADRRARLIALTARGTDLHGLSERCIDSAVTALAVTPLPAATELDVVLEQIAVRLEAGARALLAGPATPPVDRTGEG